MHFALGRDRIVEPRVLSSIRKPAQGRLYVAAVTKPRRRTQEERRTASEEALLDAAAELVAEHGIDRATLRNIGARAGTSRGLATHHFGSKDAMIERLAARAQERLAEGFRDANKDVRGQHRTTLDGLRFSIQTYLDMYDEPTADRRALVAMWGAMIPEHAAVEGMLDADRRGAEGWGQWIRNGQADGSIRSDVDPDAAGVLILALTRGIAAMHLIDPDLVDLDALRAECDAWLTAALAAS